MKTWMLLVGLFALLVVPAMANTEMSEPVDITCTIDDYVYADIEATEAISIIQDDIDLLSADAKSDIAQVQCIVEANNSAAVTVTATPFVRSDAPADILKTEYKITSPSIDIPDIAFYNGFAGTGSGIAFIPEASFGQSVNTVIPAAGSTIASFSMDPAAAEFAQSIGAVDGARSLEWYYDVQATNQTLASPAIIALAGDYTSTWTLTITADSHVSP